MAETTPGCLCKYIILCKTLQVLTQKCDCRKLYATVTHLKINPGFNEVNLIESLTWYILVYINLSSFKNIKLANSADIFKLTMQCS